jgi:hypothetical protein
VDIRRAPRLLAKRSVLIDFAGRGTLGYHTGGSTMAEFLTHEMAHAATDGDHGANWRTEMARLKGLGAPVTDDDFLRGRKGSTK